MRIEQRANPRLLLKGEFDLSVCKARPVAVVILDGLFQGLETLSSVVEMRDGLVQPIAIGAGRSMFEGVKDRLALKRTKSRTFENGCVVLWYERA
jgi:hypothetical protein